MIGQTFSLDLLSKAANLDEATVAKGLDELWQRQIIREHGNAYDFSHDRIREVAYTELSKPKCQLLHRQVARAIETLEPTSLDAVASQLAAHYERAGLLEQAIRYYQQAAEVASRFYAHEEAIRYLHRSLELLGSFPESQEKLEQELVLQTALGSSLVIGKGYAGSGVMRTLTRAKGLGERLGNQTSAPLLRALTIAAISDMELSQAIGYGKQLYDLAQTTKDKVILAEASYAYGASLFWIGKFAESRQHFEQGLAHYKPENTQTHLIHYSQDPKAVLLIRLAYALWYLGYPEQSLNKLYEALAYAKTLAHPHTLAYVLLFAIRILISGGNFLAVEQYANELVDVASKNDFPYWLAHGTLYCGWALANQNNIEAGLDVMNDGSRMMISRIEVPFRLSAQARLYIKYNNPAMALTLLQEALEKVEKHNLYCSKAEYLQMKASVLFQLGEDETAIEALYTQAIDIAQAQEAKWVELLAVTNLCRLWQKQGKKRAAFKRLSEIYTWFTEGFDTPDLQVAKALLETLA